MLGLPLITRKKLVLIDDIERKHKNYDTDEFLGFINEFSEKYETKFLLILNSDKITDSATWQQLREKVIDFEVKLSTSADEAFQIVCPELSSDYLTYVKETTIKLEISNIRILRKIISTITNLLEGHFDLAPEISRLFIPYTVLMIAAHYRGLANGITLEYIEKFSSGNSKEFTQQELEWNKSLAMVNFRRDQFFPLISEHLKSGISNQDEITAFLLPHNKNIERNRRTTRTSEFIKDCLWHPHLPEAYFKNYYNAMEEHIYEIDPQDITTIYKILKDENEHNLADVMLQKWITSANSDTNIFKRLSTGDPSVIHPLINQLKQNILKPAETKPTLLDALDIYNYIDEGPHQNIILASTKDDYAHLISTLERDNLKDFISTYIRHFQTNSPTSIFISNRIFETYTYLSSTNPRIARMISREFAARKLEQTITAA